MAFTKCLYENCRYFAEICSDNKYKLFWDEICQLLSELSIYLKLQQCVFTKICTFISALCVSDNCIARACENCI